MKAIIGSTLPVSKEATIKLKRPSQRMVMVGTPLECCVKCFDDRASEFHYKYPWHRRVWYSFLSRHGMWRGVDGKLQS